MDKVSKISKQFARYFGAALVGYVIDFGTLILLHEIFHVHYLIAASSGFVAGLCVLFVLSNKYVFGQSKLSSKAAEFSLFAIIGLVGLLILNAGMWLLTDVSGLNYILSKILATVLVYIWNFFARRSLYHDK
ncbi:MAG: GtrA family protein [Candidatus Saccharibacteria bacterium]|nr:MAG: GtrA family protein [Candidatus Saccharibacteria bacterium]